MKAAMRISGLVLVQAFFVVGLATAAEALTAAKPVDATPDLAEANQRWPAVAAGKGGYLVVWQDGDQFWGEDSDIYAARISADGKPLDPKGFVVCKAKGFQVYPTVTFDGANFLVAWSDFRNGQDWDVYGARVTPDGKVLDPDGFAIAAVPGNQAYAVAASDGKGSVFVAWSDVRPQPAKQQAEVYALFGMFVRDGKPAEASGHELVRAASSILTPTMAWDGACYLILANKGGDSFSNCNPVALAVTPDGKANSIRLGFQYAYSLATDSAGKRALVWSNGRKEHGAYCMNYATQVLSECKNVDGTRVLGLYWAYAPHNELWGAATFDGKNFVAVVEQCAGWANDWAPKTLPMTVSLAATRIDPANGKPLDAGFWDGAEKPPDKEFQALNDAKKAPTVASESGIQLRQPAMASCGGGKSLLVYSRHGGIGKFKINTVVLSE